MKKLIGKFFGENSSLVKDNMVMLIAFSIGNVFAFLYHFYMGRVLGPSEYGSLGTIIAIVYLFNVFILVIQTTVTKYVAKLRDENEKISYLMFRSLKILFVWGLGANLLFILLTPFISSFLHIKISSLIFISFFILFAALIPVTRGVLQGLQNFKGYGINFVSEAFFKIVFGVLLVVLGFGLNGAILAFVLSEIVAFFLTFIPLRKFIGLTKERFYTHDMYRYTLPILITLLMINTLYTIDIVLIKHFFDSIKVGYYAAIAILGKAIYFGTFSIGQVMFSKVSNLHANEERSKHVMYKSLFFVLLASAGVVAVYFLIPKIVLRYLYGVQYLPASNLLGIYSLAIVFFTLSYIISMYCLAINKLKFIPIITDFVQCEKLSKKKFI